MILIVKENGIRKHNPQQTGKRVKQDLYCFFHTAQVTCLLSQFRAQGSNIHILV